MRGTALSRGAARSVGRGFAAVNVATEPTKFLSVETIPRRIEDVAELEEFLSRPTPGLVADLAGREDVRCLPELPNAIFMAGRKFGTTGDGPYALIVNTCEE